MVAIESANVDMGAYIAERLAYQLHAAGRNVIICDTNTAPLNAIMSPVDPRIMRLAVAQLVHSCSASIVAADKYERGRRKLYNVVWEEGKGATIILMVGYTLSVLAAAHANHCGYNIKCLMETFCIVPDVTLAFQELTPSPVMTSFSSIVDVIQYNHNEELSGNGAVGPLYTFTVSSNAHDILSLTGAALDLLESLFPFVAQRSHHGEAVDITTVVAGGV